MSSSTPMIPRFKKIRILAAALALCLSAPVVCHAQFQTIAIWSFEPGSFLTDSSGKGNNLINGAGATQAQSVPDVIGPAGKTGSAHFDGSSVLQTQNKLDFTQFRQL
ncbi:MAG TPA: hypothetical protein VHV08_03415, partial [Pirellulales bacterium]|nr:hypothetical protein [Pirellulales bacterium]